MGRGTGQTFFQRKYEKVLKITKHKGMQIKTTMGCHPTPDRMTIIKKTRNNKHLARWGEKETWYPDGWECAATMKASTEVPQKLKTELPHAPAIPLLGIYLKDLYSC